MKILKSFCATIYKIGINPYVHLPEDALNALFKQANKSNGPIPVHGTLNGKRFIQTLVKYQGAWRLAAGVDVGDEAHIKIEFDPMPRIEVMHPKFRDALSKDVLAKLAFENSHLPGKGKCCATSTR